MNKALFLDRDGVINIEKNYVFKIADFEFTSFIFDLCKQYQNDGYLIFVVTNQAGIARGYYTEKDFNILTDWMLRQFKLNKIAISKVYFCPHHPEFTGPCECRKPKPGLILQAVQEYNIDLQKSILIGDQPSDIQAGISAGLNKCFFIQDFMKTYK